MDKLKIIAPNLVVGSGGVAIGAALVSAIHHQEQITENTLAIAASLKEFAMENHLVGATPSETYALIQGVVGDTLPAQILAMDFAGIVHEPLNRIAPDTVISLVSTIQSAAFSTQPTYFRSEVQSMVDILHPGNLEPKSLSESIASGLETTGESVVSGLNSVSEYVSSATEAISSLGGNVLQSIMDTQLGETLVSGVEMVATHGLGGDYMTMGLVAAGLFAAAGVASNSPHLIPGTKPNKAAKAGNPKIKNTNPKTELSKWNNKIAAMREARESDSEQNVSNNPQQNQHI